MRNRLLTTLLATLFVAYGGLILVLATGSHPALGLDLQGGISVTKQPKSSNFSSAALDLTVERLRERVDSLGVAEPEILRQGDTIVVNLPGVKDQQKALDLTNISGKVYLRPVLGCQEIPRSASQSTTPGTTPPGSAPAGTTPSASTPPASTPAGTTAGSATPSGWANRRSVPPGTATPGTAAPGTTPGTATPGTATPGTGTAAGNEIPESDPNSTEIRPIRPNQDVSGGYCQVGPAGGTGEVFNEDATARVSSGRGWTVDVSLKGGAGGEDVWNALAVQCYSGTSVCPSRQLAIELDGEIVSHPVVNEPRFTGSVEISGSFSEGDAKSLARVLQSGALPVELETVAVQNVSPTLGKDSLHAAIISGVVGVGLVLALMVLYYRHLGLLAIAGLSVSGSILWTIIAFLSRTQGLALSLAGIAGIIVSVGVTVDSYVVFFERLKDEVRAGRTMRNSAQRGFMGSWHTIVVADLVSLIGALVLWYLTVGSVRNFAFFLGLSTLVDLAVAWFFTRPAVLLLARTDWMAKRKVMGIEVVNSGAK